MRNLVLIVSLVVVGCGGSDEEVDGAEARCTRMRDRLVELSLADSVDVDRSAHRAAMVRALGPDLVHACERSMNGEQIECVLGAADSTAAMACATARNH
jgi:hypothetical protein